MPQRVLCMRCATHGRQGRGEQRELGRLSRRSCSNHVHKRSGFQPVHLNQLSKSALHKAAGRQAGPVSSEALTTVAGGCTDHLKVSWAEGSTKKGAQRRQEHASDVPRERPEFSQLTMRGQHAAVCKQDVIDQQDGGILGQLSGHAPPGAVQHIASL